MTAIVTNLYEFVAETLDKGRLPYYTVEDLERLERIILRVEDGEISPEHPSIQMVFPNGYAPLTDAESNIFAVRAELESRKS